MKLRQIEVNQFRNLNYLSLSPASDINLLFGENGSGKSSFLEAIYFLGTGKSFRISKTDNLIQEGKSQFTLFAKLDTNGGKLIKAGLCRTNKVTKIKVNGEFITRASILAALIPIQIIEPNLHQILNGGPEYRRRIIEWGVFHVEPRYDKVWRQFSRNLAQRNAALKKRLPKHQIQEWDRGLVEAATEIDQMRKSYLQKLFLKMRSSSLLPEVFADCTFEYFQGWPRDVSYGECLKSYIDSDEERGFTQYGPHRADIRIKIKGQNAKDVLSRGHQKFLISALLVTQCCVVKDELGKDAILLIDDLVSELDINRKKGLFRLIKEAHCQVFVTGNSKDSLIEACEDSPYKMFHVEHGDIRQVV